MSTVRQGEIRDLPDVDGHIRVLVVSSNVVNEEAYPVVVPIQRGHDDVPPYLIALGESDSVTGMVNVNWLTTVRREDLGEPVGMIAGETWVRIQAALLDILDAER